MAQPKEQTPPAGEKGAAGKAAGEKGVLSRILQFAGDRRPLLAVGCTLVAVSMLLSMVPYVVIWQVVSQLVSVAPNWGQATGIMDQAWIAAAAAGASILLYFAGLMCTHLVAFRIQTTITKRTSEHLMHVPLGYFDTHATGVLRRRVSLAAAEVEQLVAHNLADIAGTVAMFVATVVLLVLFDWRMGAACMMAVVISVASLAAMMGGDNMAYMAEYKAALDDMSKATTEYVRGIPVVKVFQQTAVSFRALRAAIDSYSKKARVYQGLCELPQSVNLTFTEGVFLLLIPVAVLLAPAAVEKGDLAGFVVDFAFYAMFSAVIATALAKVMFAASGMMQADSALSRVEEVLGAPQIDAPASPQHPVDSSISFESVSFTYEGADVPALDNVSLEVPVGSTVALVGPSGGGKTTAASLIPRFWDVTSGVVRVGGVDVRQMDPHELMDQVAFVFQSNHLFKDTILENVRAARPTATRDEVLRALAAAQCDDILDKLPEREDTLIGTGGTHLSGGEVQRVMLARAILKDAPIVVLDEATAFADPENEQLIQSALARLCAGKTVVMIAHRLSTVVGVNRIVVLDHGRVLEQGSHDELVAAGGLYARMWADYQRSATWKIQREVA